eukprot:1489225-Rhodomonas_salina.2
MLRQVLTHGVLVGPDVHVYEEVGGTFDSGHDRTKDESRSDVSDQSYEDFSDNVEVAEILLNELDQLKVKLESARKELSMVQTQREQLQRDQQVDRSRSPSPHLSHDVTGFSTDPEEQAGRSTTRIAALHDPSSRRIQELEAQVEASTRALGIANKKLEQQLNRMSKSSESEREFASDDHSVSSSGESGD